MAENESIYYYSALGNSNTKYVTNKNIQGIN